MASQESLADLQDLLAGMEEAKFLSTDGTSPVDGFRRPIAGVLIVDRSGELHLFIVLPGEDVIACSRVRSEATPVQTRSPEWDELNGKTIGIVGLGSVGSKIAMSLARMGVRKFYLVDHDVLLPENLQRHALDWQGVVQHKVDAMKVAIGRVAPGAQVEVCRLHISGAGIQRLRQRSSEPIGCMRPAHRRDSEPKGLQPPGGRRPDSQPSHDLDGSVRRRNGRSGRAEPSRNRPNSAGHARRIPPVLHR